MFRAKARITWGFLILVCLFLPGSPLRGALKQGANLPDLKAFGLQGPLPDTHGKVVLLDFWASWCAPCKASFPEMEKLYDAYSGRGFTIVAVSVDEKRQNMERFAREMKVSFPAVWDARQKLVAAADVRTMPTSFLVDRAGHVRFVHDGFRGEQTVRQYRLEIERLLKEAQ